MESPPEKLFHCRFNNAADEYDESVAQYAYTEFEKLVRINLLEQSFNKTALFPVFKNCTVSKDQIILKVTKLTTYTSKNMNLITKSMKSRVGWKVTLVVVPNSELDSRDITFKLTRIEVPASSSLPEKKHSSIVSQSIILFLYFLIFIILVFLCRFGMNLWTRVFPMGL